jgi:hypothetical protein
MNKSRLIGLAAAATLAVAAVATYAYTRSPGWEPGGPVEVPVAHGYVVRYQVGQVFTDGLERVKLRGSQPAVLRKIEISGPSADHFKVVGVMIAGPNRKLGSWEVSDGFPPTKPGLGPLVPGIGARLAPGKVGSLLLIGLKVVKPGLGIRTGLSVFYSIGDKNYVAKYPASVANCPPSMSDMQCQRSYLKAAQ